MNYSIQQQKKQRKDHLKSAIITLLISALVLTIIYFYTFSRVIPNEEKVTTMLINFGEKKERNLTEEPKNEEGDKAPTEVVKPIEKPQPQPIIEKKETVQPIEKNITGNNEKVLAKKVEEAKKETNKKPNTHPSTKTPKPITQTTENPAPQSEVKTGNHRGNTAVGNLIRGRNSKSETQKNTKNTGSSGDPLGGDNNGDSRIGVDRKLIAFIPGTMGRGGAQPSHQCTASGTITIAYTVDKAGNVTSAVRSSGVSDECVIATTVAWVKQYVKAEKAATSSTGTYKIVF